MKTEQLEKTSTQAYRERHCRYNHSPKGYARTKRYNDSDSGKACRERFFAKHGGRDVYDKEWYHRIQDEAGYHAKPRDFHPAYRLIRALTTSAVVEI